MYDVIMYDVIIHDVIVLCRYLLSCKEVVVAVCRDLMFPLPADIEGGPMLSPLTASEGDSDTETDILSLQEPSAPKVPKVNTKRCVQTKFAVEFKNDRQNGTSPFSRS